MDKWAHLGHVLGECWNDPVRSTTFVHIPKNASSFVKGCLLSSGNFTYSDSLVGADQYLITLRDPIERWASGIAQFMSVEANKHLSIDDLVNTVTFDDHTELQTYFLQGVDLNKCVFLKVNADLKSNIKLWLQKNGYIVDVDHLPIINQGDAILKNKFAAMVDGNNQIKLNLTKHYATDYELINRVKFYGT